MTDAFYAATRKGLFTIERRGERRWEISRSALLGDPVTAVLVDGQGFHHAATELGHFGVKLHRSADRGRHWEERPLPQYPPKPDHEEDIDPFRGTPVPWSLMRVWSLEYASTGDGMDLWCGTIPGGLFRSRDGGESWQIADGLWRHPDRRRWFGGGADYPGIHSILTDPRDPAMIRVAVSCGGVWTTRDAGDTWNCTGDGLRASYMPAEQSSDPVLQDPHRVVQCQESPDHLWMQHHDGIFRSRDGGISWNRVEPHGISTFGFTAAVHPANPETAWFVPATRDDARYAANASVSVTRTRDGGASVESLRRGLPQQHAYDLVYRHALDIDMSGDRLAFGSTSGGLWVSENQGDEWTCVSTHLPPVYCVRFIPDR